MQEYNLQSEGDRFSELFRYSAEHEFVTSERADFGMCIEKNNVGMSIYLLLATVASGYV